MAMLTLRIDDELNDRLTALAKKTGRTKTFFVKQLLNEMITELEDEIWFQEQAAEVIAEYKAGKPRRFFPLEQVLKELGIDEVPN
jgi:RHH-type rel operon transcriptional repressor/antitoxin RelB